MEDSPTTKPTPTNVSRTADLMKKGLFFYPHFCPFGTRRSMALVYCFFTFAFVTCTTILFFNNPSNTHSSLWFSNILNTRSHFSSIFSHFFPNPNTSTTTSHSSPSPSPSSYPPHDVFIHKSPFFPETNASFNGTNQLLPSPAYKTNNTSQHHHVMGLNGTTKGISEMSNVTFSHKKNDGKINNLSNGTNESLSFGHHASQTSSSSHEFVKNATTTMVNSSSESVKNIPVDSSKNATGEKEMNMMPNRTDLFKKHSDGGAKGVSMPEQRKENWLDELIHCDIFDGTWVKDDSYPLYSAGTCPHIDEPFDCFHNGRPDNGYENYRWQPKGCNIPRLVGGDLLELLRGKRLVYVGDSLNRNMWESMLCTLRNSVKDKSKVFEASGREQFRTEGSYSFLFTDYNFSVEFFRSTFLVQEWEMPDTNGSTKETLRLDLIERSSDRYKNADILVFNTGHWWTHEKTSQGKGYYQEGSHVYGLLDVVEAFRKAMTTWARWIDANVNPTKTLVSFRGYSASHFSGGQWNSGGQCDNETEPIKNEAYLSENLQIMSMLEQVIKGMKTSVFYLNVTKMTDFRKDAHPSIYRKQNLTKEERRSPLRFQDCSHWCLPGVPDTWNELLYSQIFIKYNQKEQQQQQK
ncbi:protein trichome birefringence-like 1 [Camellia sinensis]|uniref:protein trichome birefringence-like 1 n=1 Tax=Camellia sinensis TaxID=4442 RepID=UPI0010364FEA|nr:protein trichome birefringence-like 1 [Camellia sinensis]